MLYTLIGNGNPNKKEVIATLQSLYEAAEGDFWMVLVIPDDPSNIYTGVRTWLDHNMIDYELVFSAEAAGEFAALWPHAQETYVAKRPTARALALSAGRVDAGEKWALLVMSDDLDNDEDALFAINACIDNGVEVFALAGQMTPLTIENEYGIEIDPADNVPQADVVHTPDPAVVEALKLAERVQESPLMDLTREDLESLTRDELRSLAAERGVTPKDGRLKDSIIEALLLTETAEENKPRRVVSTSPSRNEKMTGWRYVLVSIAPDGVVQAESLSDEQYSLLAF